VAKAITLSGVEQAANVPSQYRVCTPVEVWSPTLNANVTVCRESVPTPSPMPVPQVAPGKSKGGRPKGSRPGTANKKGRTIAPPKFAACSRYGWTKTKKGPRCKCTSGQGKFAPNRMCGGPKNAG
jgi:hypothetical protein